MDLLEEAIRLFGGTVVETHSLKMPDELFMEYVHEQLGIQNKHFKKLSLAHTFIIILGLRGLRITCRKGDGFTLEGQAPEWMHRYLKVCASEIAEIAFPTPVPSPREYTVDELKAMPYTEYLQTEHWKRTVAMMKWFENYQCRMCKSPIRLEVHHNNYRRRGQERPEDLIVVCHECHAKHHGKQP